MAITEKEYLLIEKGKSRYMLLKSQTHFHMVRLNGMTEKQMHKLLKVYPCDSKTLKELNLHVSAFRCESLRRVVLAGYEAWDEITLWIGAETRKYTLSKSYSEEMLDDFFREQQRSWQFLKKPEVWRGLDPELIHRICFWMNAVCMAIPTLFFFGGKPNKLLALLSICCQLAPLLLVLVYPESFTLLESKSSYPKQKWKCPGSLMGAFLAPGFGLALRVFSDFTFFEGGFWQLMSVAAVIWLVMLIPLIVRTGRVRENLGESIALAAILLFLNLGIAGQLNVLLDFQPVAAYRATVVDLHSYVGVKGGTSYYCTVDLSDGVQADISVSKTTFQNTKIGQNMSVEDHQGAFGIRFLTLPKE